MCWLILAMVLWGTNALQAQDESQSPASLREELVFYRKGDPDRGREKFFQFECVKCHRVQADPDLPEPQIGSRAPLLGSFSHVRSPEELSRAILTPSHKSGGNSLPAMPTDYQKRLSSQELIDLVTYLRTAQN